jgi:hypothetical protein
LKTKKETDFSLPMILPIFAVVALLMAVVALM